MDSAKPQTNRLGHGLRSGRRDLLCATFWLTWGVCGWHTEVQSLPGSLTRPGSMHPGERRHGEGRAYRTPGFVVPCFIFLLLGPGTLLRKAARHLAPVQHIEGLSQHFLRA